MLVAKKQPKMAISQCLEKLTSGSTHRPLSRSSTSFSESDLDDDDEEEREGRECKLGCHDLERKEHDET